MIANRLWQLWKLKSVTLYSHWGAKAPWLPSCACLWWYQWNKSGGRGFLVGQALPRAIFPKAVWLESRKKCWCTPTVRYIYASKSVLLKGFNKALYSNKDNGYTYEQARSVSLYIANKASCSCRYLFIPDRQQRKKHGLYFWMLVALPLPHFLSGTA